MYLLNEIKKHIFIYYVFVKNCLISQMEYRVNFITGIIVECVFLCIKTSYVIVVYSTGVVINGLTPDAVLLFIGTYTIINGVMCGLFFYNFISLSDYVREGTLDFFITKPISLQFMATLRKVDFGTPIPNMVGGTVMIVIAWSRLGLRLDFANIAGYLVLCAGSLIVTYAVLLIPSMASFWVIKTQSLNDITYALWDFNNMPMGIYSKLIQRVGIFIIPIFVISNFPPMFVLGKLNVAYAVWAVVVPLLSILVSRLVWRLAVKNYVSASS